MISVGCFRDVHPNEIRCLEVFFSENISLEYDILFIECQRATLTPTNKPGGDKTPQRLYSTQKVENGTQFTGFSGVRASFLRDLEN
jgi:hypothetical protein